MNRPTKKKMVTHSTSPNLLWTLSDCASAFLPMFVIEQQERRPEHGDGRRLQAQRVGEQEGHDDQSEHGEGLLQQGHVGDRLALPEAHDVRATLVAGSAFRGRR